jgi:MFS family permease
MAHETSGDDAQLYPTAWVAWYAVGCLLLCGFMFWVDRNILTLLVGPVRHDLSINDAQIGLLNGYAFSVVTGLMAVPYGWYADRRSRRNLLMFGIGLWGASTIAAGFATSFGQLVAARMGLGIGEAALSPAVFSLVADYFPKAKRGRAIGMYGIGSFAGIGLSYLIGGAILASFRGVDIVTLPVVGATSLWHAAFLVVGFATVLVSLLLVTVREPLRVARTSRAAESGVSFFQHVRRHWRAFWLVIGGYTCLGIVSIGWFAWLPSYFIRVFKMPPISAGIEVGWVTTISGVLGAVAGGFIADSMTRRGIRGGKEPTLVIMYLAWIPCALGLYLSDSPSVSLLCVFVFTFADGIGFMQYGNVMQEMFPNHLRARSIAAWMVCVSVLNYGVGPLMFGLSTDYLFKGESGLRSALGLISLPVIAIGLAFSWYARRPYDRARLAVDPTARVDQKWVRQTPSAVPALEH